MFTELRGIRCHLLGLLVACILFSFILYAPILRVYFFAEDLIHISFNWTDIVAEFWSTGRSVGYRPGETLFIVINNVLWGRNPLGHHAVIVALHALMGWFVGLICFRLTKNFQMAFVAALLFLASPIQTEPVIWLAAAVGTVVSSVACMVAIWLWIRSDAEPGTWTIGITAFLYLIAILTKEFALPLPGLLVVFDWVLKRRFQPILSRGTIRSVLFYWPFGLVLIIYALLYWHSGAWGGAVSYSIPTGINPLYLIAHFSLSLNGLFQPFSGLTNFGTGMGNLLWILVFGLLVALSHMRWTFALTFVALLPSLLVTGGRMEYLAMTGFSMGISGLLFDLAKIISNRITGKLFLSTLVGMTGLLLIWCTATVYRDSAYFIAAGDANWSILRQARSLVPDLPPGAELYFTDIPDDVTFRWGLTQEIRYVFSDSSLSVYVVRDGPPEWDQISLSTVQCKSAAAQLYFRYSVETEIVSLVDSHAFGLSCP